jgi:hypothetical protein
MKFVTACFYVFALLIAIARPVFASDDGKCLSKLNNIRNELSEHRQSTRRWATVWGVTWGTATAVQLGVAVGTGNSEARKDLWVGSASAALGLIPTLIVPPEATHDFTLTGDCENELSQAESLIERFSANSETYDGLIAHVSNVAVNLAASLVMGLGFGHWGAAAINFAAGIPIGEMMILTYPKFEAQLHNTVGLSPVPCASGPVLAITFGF